MPDAAGNIIRLPLLPPYDWAAMSGFLATRAIPGVERIDAAGCYHRVVTVDGIPGIISIAREADSSALRLTIEGLALPSHPAIAARVARIFDLAADPLTIATALGRDPILGPLVAARPGLRVPGAWDGFELAIRAILGQQITVTAATRLAGKLVARFGEPLPATGIAGLTHAFPSPDTLATADLTILGMPTSRARALSAVAAAALAEPDLFAADQSLERAITRLKSVKGIGDWTAHYIAMRALRQPDAFPTADIGLMRALADRDGRRPTPAELLSRAEAWRPWRAYAALHLWMSETPLPA